jgi:hypothetical protein
MIEHIDMSSQFCVFCACQVMWSEKVLSIIVIERLSYRKNGQMIFSGTLSNHGLRAVIETVEALRNINHSFHCAIYISSPLVIL